MIHGHESNQWIQYQKLVSLSLFLTANYFSSMKTQTNYDPVSPYYFITNTKITKESPGQTI